MEKDTNPDYQLWLKNWANKVILQAEQEAKDIQIKLEDKIQEAYNKKFDDVLMNGNKSNTK